MPVRLLRMAEFVFEQMKRPQFYLLVVTALLVNLLISLRASLKDEIFWSDV